MNTTPITEHPADDYLHPTTSPAIAAARAAYGRSTVRGTVHTLTTAPANDARADAAAVAAYARRYSAPFDLSRVEVVADGPMPRATGIAIAGHGPMPTSTRAAAPVVAAAPVAAASDWRRWFRP